MQREPFRIFSRYSVMHKERVRVRNTSFSGEERPPPWRKSRGENRRMEIAVETRLFISSYLRLSLGRVDPVDGLSKKHGKAFPSIYYWTVD